MTKTRAGVEFHGERRNVARRERLDCRGVRVRLEEADEDQVLAHAPDLVYRRRLHLEEDVRFVENLCLEACTLSLISCVEKASGLACTGLDDNLQAGLSESRHEFGNKRHPLLARERLFRNADDHRHRRIGADTARSAILIPSGITPTNKSAGPETSPKSP